MPFLSVVVHGLCTIVAIQHVVAPDSYVVCSASIVHGTSMKHDQFFNEEYLLAYVPERTTFFWFLLP